MSASQTARAKRGQSRPFVKSVKTRRVSQAVKNGRAAGLTLAENTARLLLAEYSNRPCPEQSASTKSWVRAWDSLQVALGVMANDPKVQLALKEIDGAHGDGLVEHEDSAWHAAWTVAMSLRGAH